MKSIFIIVFTLSFYIADDIFAKPNNCDSYDTMSLGNKRDIAMYVKTGNEEDLLRMANYNAVCRDVETKQILALEYPYLQSKLLRN